MEIITLDKRIVHQDMPPIMQMFAVFLRTTDPCVYGPRDSPNDRLIATNVRV